MLDQKQRLNTLTSSLNNLWQPTKTGLEMKLPDILLLQNFFGKWVEEMDDGVSSKDAYKEALKTLPKDNPATTNFNESITEDQLKEKVKFFFGKPLFSNSTDPNSHVNTDDVKDLQGNMAFLKTKIRYFYAMTFLADSEIRHIQKQIDSINAAVRSASEYDDGSEYEDNLLT